VVDLDGAFAGHPVNLETIRTIVAAVSIPVEVGGGIRNGADLAQVFAAGARWAILGTAVLDDLDFVASAAREYPGRILVGLDARDGMVATRGWLETTALSAAEAGRKVKALGVTQVIYTDISRDGTLTGPNVAATRELAKSTGLSVIASGGVSGPNDILALLDAEADGVDGVVVGKAIYSGSLDLREAIALGHGEAVG
jgi:phosphoribosylformimino-5-aminoimidazole carboxamide ribotide isomerase